MKLLRKEKGESTASARRSKKKKGKRKEKKYLPVANESAAPPIQLPDGPLPPCKHVDEVVMPRMLFLILKESAVLKRVSCGAGCMDYGVIQVNGDGRGKLVKEGGCATDIDYGYLAYRTNLKIYELNAKEGVGLGIGNDAYQQVWLSFRNDNHNALVAWWKNLHGIECRLGFTCLDARSRCSNINTFSIGSRLNIWRNATGWIWKPPSIWLRQPVP